MKNLKIIILIFLFVGNTLITRIDYAQITIPKEDIPQDISIEVREQIERLYSLDVKKREDAINKLGDTTIVEKRTFKGNCFPPIPLPIPLSEKVVIALTKIGNSTVKPLTEALKNENPNIRKGAAETLGKIKDLKSIEALFEMLKDDDFKVRSKAAFALVEYKGLVIDRLLQALNDENAHVRGYSLFTLDHIISSNEINDSRIFESAVRALKDVDKYVRRNAANVLGSLKDARAVEPLIEALKDETWDVKMGAAKALGDLKDSKAVKPLVLMLRDPALDNIALKALVEIGKPSVESLIDALQNYRSRSSASKALGEIKDDRAFKPLIQLLIDGDHNVRINAAKALDKIYAENKNIILNKQNIEIIINALEDPSYVRGRTTYILGKDKAQWKELLEK